jgi:excisionase family DNA binding protein
MRYYSCMGNFYLSPTQVASKLHVGVESIRRYLRSGELIGIHVSRKCWRISDDDLNDFLKKRKR